MKIFQRFFRTVLVISFAAALSGCASGAKPTAMAPASISAIADTNTFDGAISTTTVSGGKETSPLWQSNISSDDFQVALENSLKQAGLFSADGNLSLQAELLKVKKPLMGINMKVTMSVRYTLTNDDGTVVYQNTITTPYTAKFGTALNAVKRLRLANEGAARANLEALLQDLNNAGAGNSISASTS